MVLKLYQRVQAAISQIMMKSKRRLDVKITLTNAEIYELTETLKANALGEKTYIPVMFNFYIQKNIKILYTLREEIDRCRNQILSHYG